MTPVDAPDSSLGPGLTCPPWRIEYVETATSTNAQATADPVDKRVLCTNHQTAGRGRRDRVWETPAGVALTFSATFDPQVPDRQWPLVPLVVGLAVHDALPDTALKWPNDVLLRGRKLAGILVERVHPAGSPALAVAGVGVNVHQLELPVDTATSLALESLAEPRGVLLCRILDRLQARLQMWRSGADPLLDYRQVCATIGEQVRVELPDDTDLTGAAEAVDDFGRLVVGGVAVGAGDVVHVRVPR